MREAEEQQILVLGHHRVPELHVLNAEEVTEDVKADADLSVHSEQVL